MSTEAVSPLRRRIIEDMTIRQSGDHTKRDYVRQGSGRRSRSPFRSNLSGRREGIPDEGERRPVERGGARGCRQIRAGRRAFLLRRGRRRRHGLRQYHFLLLVLKFRGRVRHGRERRRLRRLGRKLHLMPARCVVARDGKKLYAKMNPDYTRRPEPDDMLSVLRRDAKAAV